jgi:secreted trypsin-like serine protease
MHEKLVWGLIMVALSGCSAGGGEEEAAVEVDREAIVGGHSDRGKDAAVVAISIGGEGLCTGSLIAPSWVLTARHCVSNTDETVQCPARATQVHGEQPADTFTILVGDDIGSARPVAIGRRVVVPTSNLLCEHDIALIQLDRDVAGVKPLELGSLSGVQKVRGVGFGKRGDRAGAGKKMTRTGVSILETSTAEFQVGVLSCSGDSGGPALDAGGKVVGVVSRGGPNCSGSSSRNIYTRVDAFETFIEHAIGTTSPTPLDEASCGPGKRCPNGSHCNQSTLRCEAAPQ